MVAIVADDLTGALDAAAPFARAGLSAGVVLSSLAVLSRPVADRAVIAWDLATREVAADRVGSRLGAWRSAEEALHGDGALFLKIDSVLRGHPAATIAAAQAIGDAAACLVAPAYPYFGRTTVAGRHQASSAAGVVTCPDLVAALGDAGVPVTLCSPGDAAPSGVSVWNASTDADLDAVIAAGAARPDKVCWCGSGGLAAALARALGEVDGRADATDWLPPPDLFLVGTDHPVTAAQVKAAGLVRHAIDPDAASRATIDRAPGIVTVHQPEGVSRGSAAHRVAAGFASLLSDLATHRALLVTGGETLRALCDAAQAGWIELVGEVEPGVPVGIVRGGALDGIVLYSKSGGFGDPDLFTRLSARGVGQRNLH